MFNLLPKETKEAIRHEYRMRLAVVILWVCAATFLIASVLLIPSLLLSSAKERATLAQYKAFSQSIAAGEATHLDDALIVARDTLKFFPAAPPQTQVYTLLARIASAKPAGISLSDMTVTIPASGKRRIDIQGTASDRSALVAFTGALEALKLFEGVAFPLGNLAKDADIDFSITVTALQ